MFAKKGTYPVPPKEKKPSLRRKQVDAISSVISARLYKLRDLREEVVAREGESWAARDIDLAIAALEEISGLCGEIHNADLLGKIR